MQVDSPSSAEEGFDAMNWIDKNIIQKFKTSQVISQPVNRTVATTNIIVNNQQKSTTIPVPIVMGDGGNMVTSGGVNNNIDLFNLMQASRLG